MGQEAGTVLLRGVNRVLGHLPNTVPYQFQKFEFLFYLIAAFGRLLGSTLRYSSLVHSTLLHFILLYSTLLYSNPVYSILFYSTKLYYPEASKTQTPRT